MSEELFNIETYRTDVQKEQDGVVCYISGIGDKGPGFRIRSTLNNPEFVELDRQLAIKYQDKLRSSNSKLALETLHNIKVELLTKTLITEAVRFVYPGTTKAWKYTPESGQKLFSQSGYSHIVELLMEFAGNTSNYRFEAPTEEEVDKAADAVKKVSSSGKRTRKNK